MIYATPLWSSYFVSLHTQRKIFIVGYFCSILQHSSVDWCSFLVVTGSSMITWQQESVINCLQLHAFVTVEVIGPDQNISEENCFHLPPIFPERYKAVPMSPVFLRCHVATMRLQCKTELDVHSVPLVMHFLYLLFEISLIVNQNSHATHVP